MQLLTHLANLRKNYRRLAPGPKVEAVRGHIQQAETVLTQTFIEHSRNVPKRSPLELQKLIDMAG